MESDQEPFSEEILDEDQAASAGEAAEGNRDLSIENELLDAIEDGDIAAVQRYLDENVGINSTPSYRESFSAAPLSWAVRYGREEIVIELLDRGAAIDEQSSEGLTPLSWAVRNNHVKIVAELLSRGANTEVIEEKGATPLWEAVANRYYECMRLLLENGADVNVMDNEGVTILHRAVANRDTDCVRELLEGRKITIGTQNSEGVSVLHQAVKSDDLEIVKLLLEKRKKSTKDKRLRLKRVQTIMNTKDGIGESPILRAILNRSQETTLLLLSEGATLGTRDQEGDSELSRAIYDGSKEIAKLLIENGADTQLKNCTKMTAFLWSAYKDNVSVGEMLLARGAEMSEADENGLSALHFAVERGQVNFLEMMLRVITEKLSSKFKKGRKKAEGVLEAKESRGFTPLLFALSSPWYREHFTQSTKVVELLLDHGADPSSKNDNGQNALHVAVGQEFTEAVGMLLSRMDLQDVCAQDQDGDTPLHLACRTARDSENLVGLILDTGDMPHEALTAKNSKVETALDLAIGRGNSCVLQLLVNKGVDVRYRNKLGQDWPTVDNFSHEQLLNIEKILLNNEQSWAPIDLLGTLNWSARNGRETPIRKILSTKDYATENLAKDVIYWAAVGGQSGIISWLFQEYGEYMLSNNTGSRAVLAAAVNGHHKTVGEVIRNLVRLDEHTFSIGKKAGEEFQVSTAQFGSTIMNTAEWTPLHWVVNYGPEIAIDVIRHMLINGADPEAKKGGLSAREMATYWGRSSEGRSKILTLIQAPLRVSRKSPQLEEPLVGAGTARKEICQRSSANIIDFCTTNGRNCTLESKSTVYDIIYNSKSGPGAVMNEARDAWSLDGMDLKLYFRWMHLPANNWTWAEDLARRIYSEPPKSNTGYTRVKGFMEAYRREHKGKPFSRFMYPALSFERAEFPSAEGDAIFTLHQNLTVPSEADIMEDHEKSKFRNIQNPFGSVSHNMSDTVANSLNEPALVGDETATAPRIRVRVINKELTRKKNVYAATGGDPWDSVVIPEHDPEPVLEPFLQEHKIPKKKAKKGAVDSWGEESALKGVKMAICVPFLTFHSVSSHRALRQTVRLTEEANRLQRTENESLVESLSSEVTAEKSSSPEERRKAERSHKDKTRKYILETEVKKGLKLLRSTNSSLFEYFNNRWSQIKHFDQKARLRSLRVIHLTMRKNVENNAPGIMEWLERLSDAISISTGTRSATEDPKHELLVESYLNPQEETGLHPSRTLDQYYYSALSDTSRRDVDQVVRRYQVRAAADQCYREAEQAVIEKEQEEMQSVGISKKRRKLEQLKLDDENKRTPHWEDDPDAQICMVDQLWLWVLDDETIVTCFPPSSGPESKNKGGVDLLDRIREHIHDDTRPHISSVYHLATLITSLSVRFVEECHLQSKDSLLHTFASSIGTVADEEVKCFENFRLDISQSRNGQSKTKKRAIIPGETSYRDKIQNEIQERVDKVYRERYPHSSIEDFHAELGRLEAVKAAENRLELVEVDIQKEIMLLEEIKDIRDELNILKSIFEDQRNLLNKLFTLVRASHLEGREATQTDINVDYYQERSDINLRLEKVNKMEMDAKITYDSINHLLDLKQKNANLSEAVQARKQAEQSAQQGRTILVFTIVTIVFLPLSFLSSFYSLKIESFPRVGNDSLFPDTWIFTRIFGTSAAIAIPLIIIAVYVNDLLEYYQRHLRKRISSIWIDLKGAFSSQSQVMDSDQRKAKGKWGFGLRKKERLTTIEDGKNR